MSSQEAPATPLPLPELVLNISLEQFLGEQLTAGQGCPLCRAAEHDEFALFAALVARVVREADNPPVGAAPLCNRHAGFFLRVGGPKPTACLCLYLLTQTPSLPTRGVAQLTMRCPACLALNRRQREWLATFQVLLNEQSHRDAYLRGHGLCLPHLSAATAWLTDEGILALLESSRLGQCERLIAQLELVVQRGVFRVPGPVSVCPRQTVEKLFGCPGLTDYLWDTGVATKSGQHVSRPCDSEAAFHACDGAQASSTDHMG